MSVNVLVEMRENMSNESNGYWEKVSCENVFGWGQVKSKILILLTSQDSMFWKTDEIEYRIPEKNTRVNHNSVKIPAPEGDKRCYRKWHNCWILEINLVQIEICKRHDRCTIIKKRVDSKFHQKNGPKYAQAWPLFLHDVLKYFWLDLRTEGITTSSVFD